MTETVPFFNSIALVVALSFAFGCEPSTRLQDDQQSQTGAATHRRIEEHFEPYLRTKIDELDIPGFAIAVVEGNELVYNKATGVGNVETGAPLSTASIFHMASVTKTFTASAIMKLAEQGLIDIEEPLVRYLPYFVLQDERYDKITVRHALSHISGMPDYDSNPWQNVSYDEGALERFTRDFVSQKRLSADPGEEYQYCNTLYEVLGDVVAKVSNQSFADYVQEHILNPLGMENSTLLIKNVDSTLLTTPHIIDGDRVTVSEVFPYNRMHGPSSTLLASVDDMSRWLIANLNQGTFNGVSVLQGETLDQMWQPAGEKYDHVGICWHLGEFMGMRTVSHGGGDVGFRSYVMLVPERSFGVVVASNFSRTPMREIVDEMLDAVFGKDE